jgi:hypothetical protein
MFAPSFGAFSTSKLIYFKAHNFQFESISFYFNFYITLFDWLKQLRSLSIDTPFRAIPIPTSRLHSPRHREHRQNSTVEKHPSAAHLKQHKFNPPLSPTTPKQATQKLIQELVDCYISFAKKQTTSDQPKISLLYVYSHK